jgi:hypothetical protein
LVRPIPSANTDASERPGVGEGWGGETRRSARTWPNHRFGPHHQRRLNEIITLGITDEQVAEEYLLKRAKQMAALFEEAHRRPARTVEELNEWVRSPERKHWLALEF